MSARSKFGGGVFGTADHSKPIVSGEARIDEGAILEGPCFIEGREIDSYSVGRVKAIRLLSSDFFSCT